MAMVRTKVSIGMKKALSVSHVCLILMVAVSSVSWGMQPENVPISNCAFTKYLEDPGNRAKYEFTFAKARASYASVNNYDNAAMYGVIVKAGFDVENGENLDSFSAGCLSCHDGKSASNVRPNLQNTPDKKSIMKMVSAKHPIGMDYEKYSTNNKNLKSLDEMSQDLTLAEGRVSCITCHDPLNSGRNHLTITKTGIDLCSACHIF
jgi:predicted CXXCH cytochrome family protein